LKKFENPKKIEKFLKLKNDTRMAAFDFPQFEHKLFWRYLSKLNDYLVQLNQTFEKWESCEVSVVGLNFESRGYVKSICHGDLLGVLSRTQDEVWDFFEKLAWDTYEFEQPESTLRYPTQGKYASYANTYHQDHFNSHDPSYTYVFLSCAIIVSLLIMILVIVLIIIMLMLHVQVLKRR